MSFGPVKVGDARVKLDLNDYKVEKEFKNRLIKAKFVPNSEQWVRDANNLLTPRARLAIMIYKTEPNVHIEFHNRTIVPQRRGKHFYAEIYVNLFDPDVLKIVENNTVVEKLHTYTDIKDKSKNTIMIDYSCSRYGLKISGLNDEYVSVGWKKPGPGDMNAPTWPLLGLQLMLK